MVGMGGFCGHAGIVGTLKSLGSTIFPMDKHEACVCHTMYSFLSVGSVLNISKTNTPLEQPLPLIYSHVRQSDCRLLFKRQGRSRGGPVIVDRRLHPMRLFGRSEIPSLKGQPITSGDEC